MSELAKVAERIRSASVRESEFLGRFAAEILLNRPMLLDGMLADLDRHDMTSAPDARAESALGPRSWRV